VQGLRAPAHDVRPDFARPERAPPARFRPASRVARAMQSVRPPRKEVAMTDLSIIVITAALFGAALFFVRLCERM